MLLQMDPTVPPSPPTFQFVCIANQHPYLSRLGHAPSEATRLEISSLLSATRAGGGHSFCRSAANGTIFSPAALAGLRGYFPARPGLACKASGVAAVLRSSHREFPIKHVFICLLGGRASTATALANKRRDGLKNFFATKRRRNRRPVKNNTFPSSA